MSPSLTTDQVLALAPDAASAKAGRGLAAPRAWAALGRGEGAVWGECQGSGRSPYRTQVDLGAPAFRCSCPSRKFPCKHSLGLLLLLAEQPAAVPQAAPPAWVADWLASRARSAARREDVAEGSPARASSRAKSTSAREAKVAAGMQELARWLRDQLREGLAGIPQRSPAAFDRIAARMVDAQAPGAARLLRALSGAVASGEGWQGRLLERLARLHLLAEGYARVDALAPAERAELRGAIGFTQRHEELLGEPGRRDRWLVLGRRVEEEGHLRVQRTWLWGLASAAPALVLDFSAGGQPLDRSLTPGSLIDAELVFFPAAVPLRALVQRRHGSAAPEGFPGSDIAAALGGYAAALAGNPWLERYPLCLGPVTLALRDGVWLARDESGRALALSPLFERSWELLARGGGRPFALCGEWDGDQLTPLSAWFDRFVDLGGPGPAARPPAGRAPIAIWGELVAAAMLGTDRRPPDLPAAGGELGALLGRLAASDDPPGELLGAAAAVASYQRAGWLPQPDSAPAFAPGPPDDLPACPARAGRHLAKMLAGEHEAALPEWLAALAASGRAAPAGLLPALLDQGGKSDSIRALITPVLGARGRWLAGLNPDWGYAFAPPAPARDAELTALWETGTRAARQAALSQLRATDPARARDLLIATWTTEKADDRAAFLASLEQGLSMADEPFLEQALADRSVQVRKYAAHHLASLPESRLTARMVARLMPLLSWDPGRLLQRPGLAVSLPEECDASMERDGIIPRPMATLLGERAWWLSQMIELVPPARWCAAWGAAPGEILAARLPREWRELLLAGWAKAAARHRDQPWLEALVAMARAGEKSLKMGELLPALSPDRRTQIALELLTAGEPLSGGHPALPVLRSLPGPWDLALAWAALAALGRRFRADDEALRTDWGLRAALELLAARMPADLADEAAALIPEPMYQLSAWRSAATAFVDLLRFRREMLGALQAV